MRQLPPKDFSVSRFFEGIYTFQGWEIFPGHKTNGKDVVALMRDMGVPADLRGKRVLDIAPWNGFFTFECIRRGAAEVVSLGPDDPEKTGYYKVRDLLEVGNCKYVRASVYDLSPAVHGVFDVVLFLGLIYHLRHPLLALDKIHDVTGKDLYVDTPIMDRMVFDKTISDELKNQILDSGRIVHELPLAYFTKGAETGDDYNWFIPNSRAFHDWVESSGFTIRRSGDDGGGWAWLAAEKGQRLFTVGIEGFNPGTVTFGSNN